MSSFSLDDILINIVPGGLIIFTFLYLTNGVNYLTSSESLIIIGLFVVLSFTLIELSTEISNQPSWDPNSFEETVFAIRNAEKIDPEKSKDINILGKILTYISIKDTGITKSKEEFWPIAANKYDLDEKFEDYVELYRLVMHSIEPLNNRTKRVQRLYLFYRNLSISVIVVSVMFLLSMWSLVGSLFPFSIIGILFLVLFSLFIFFMFLFMSLVLWRRSRRAEQEFINELMAEFYQQEIDLSDTHQNRSLLEYK